MQVKTCGAIAMQGNVPEVIRQLMDAQHLSIRKVSARIAAQHGGSEHGYTQQINRILNDPTYDPTLTTVQKILAALNVSLWQAIPQSPVEVSDLDGLTHRFDHLSQELAEVKQAVNDLNGSLSALIQMLQQG